MNNRPVTDNEVGARSNGYKSGWDESRVDAEAEVAELTEQLHKSQAEVYRMMQVNRDLREWWSASATAMRDKRREHLARST